MSLLQDLVLQACHMLNVHISAPSVCGKVHFTVQTLVWSLHSSVRLMFNHSRWMNKNVYVWPVGVSLSVRGETAIGQPFHD